jgi:hypothetical protein
LPVPIFTSTRNANRRNRPALRVLRILNDPKLLTGTAGNAKRFLKPGTPENDAHF